MKHKIVTNGKRYRLKGKNGYHETWHSSPEGGGFSSVWETRFYIRALRRAAWLTKVNIRDAATERWEAI